MPINLKELLSLVQPIPRKKGSPKVIPAHPESDMDEQMDADREWFAKHPFADQYYRKPYACEVSEFVPLCKFPNARLKKVLVMRTDVDGIRAKRPIFEPDRSV